MLFDLPLDVEKIINKYDEDFITKKFVIIKAKIEGEILRTECYLSKVCKFNQIFEVMKSDVMRDLQKESQVGSSFQQWIGNIKRELLLPKDICEYTTGKRRKLKHYEQLLSECENAVYGHCKHRTLRGDSDDDYHRPRYEFHCTLCHKQVYRCNINADTKIIWG